MQEDETKGKNIWNNILQRSTIPLKWGFEFRTVKTIESGTAFKVNTQFIKGWVKIQQTSHGTFKIGIKPDNFGSELIYEDISADKLISTIDRVLRQGIFTDNSNLREYREAV